MKDIIKYDNNIATECENWHNTHKPVCGVWINPWYIINVRTKNALVLPPQKVTYPVFPTGRWQQLLNSIEKRGPLVTNPVFVIELKEYEPFWKRYTKDYHKPEKEIKGEYAWMIEYGERFLPDKYDASIPYFYSLDGRHRVICCRYLKKMVPAILFERNNGK